MAEEGLQKTDMIRLMKASIPIRGIPAEIPAGTVTNHRNRRLVKIGEKKL